MCDKLKVLKLSENATLPTRGSLDSAGLDLYACIENDVVIKSGESVMIETGIAIALPKSTAGLIYARSGLSTKFGINLTNGVGVVDSDYRGEVKVALFNISKNDYTVKPNERIAQLVVTPVLLPEVLEVESLDETERGQGGFGSTGKH